MATKAKQGSPLTHVPMCMRYAGGLGHKFAVTTQPLDRSGPEELLGEFTTLERAKAEVATYQHRLSVKVYAGGIGRWRLVD